MLSNCLDWDRCVLNELTHSTQLFNTLIPCWPMVGHGAYTVICSVMHDLQPVRYPTVDSMVDVGSTSDSVEHDWLAAECKGKVC